MALLGEPELKRVIFCGSRGWDSPQAVRDALTALPGRLGDNDVTVVHGGARGADRIADREARLLGYQVEVHLADWHRYGNRAGLIRNHQMAEAGADLCIAAWDGRSSGTAHMLEQARKKGIPVQVITA